MSGPLGQPTDQPKVFESINPSAVGQSAQAPRRNAALELAGSLAEISPLARDFAGQYADWATKDARDRASKIAIENKGTDFAELVRTGKIEPTQSPWFMQAYHQESARVRTMAAIDTLNADAATWPERNDPNAFQDRWTKSLQQLGQTIGSDADSQAGFSAAAGPAQQQAFAGNTELNVQRIIAENQQNIASAIAQAVRQVNSMHGGKASKAQLEAALEPLYDKWSKVGLADADWNKSVLSGLVGAAEATQNPNLVDEARVLTNRAGGSLYDNPGAAEQLELVRHRIKGNINDQLRTAMAERQFHDYTQDRNASAILLKTLGPGVLSGMSSDTANQAVAILSKNGFDAESIAHAVGTFAKSANDLKMLQAAHWADYKGSPEGVAHLGALQYEAKTQGWSPAFQDELGQLALTQNVSLEDIHGLSDQAMNTTNKIAGGVDKAGQRHRQANINDWLNIRNTATSRIVATINYNRKQSGVDLSPTEEYAVHDAALTAASSFLLSHPRITTGNHVGQIDIDGALKAATIAASAWWRSYYSHQTSNSPPAQQ